MIKVSESNISLSQNKENVPVVQRLPEVYRRESLAFYLDIHKSLKESVYIKKIQATSVIFRGSPRERVVAFYTYD